MKARRPHALPAPCVLRDGAMTGAITGDVNLPGFPPQSGIACAALVRQLAPIASHTSKKQNSTNCSQEANHVILRPTSPTCCDLARTSSAAWRTATASKNVHAAYPVVISQS